MPHRNVLAARRDPIKGLAIIWVCFFHARLGLEPVSLPGILQQVGYLGVDIFTLLSGFGLWHSLERSPSSAAYLKRRACRLLPAFLPVALLWCLCMPPALGLGLRDGIHAALGTLTMTGYLTGAPYTLNWYLSLLLVTILLAVPVHAVISKRRFPGLCFSVLVLLAVLCGVLFFGKNQLMLISRLPIFLLGMALAGTKPRREHPKAAAWLCFAGFLAGASLLWYGFARRPDWLLRYGLYWYPGLLLVPGLCAATSRLMDELSSIGLRFSMLTTLGKASFEIFLFNCWFELLLKRVLSNSEPLIHLLFALLSIILGLVWHMAAVRFARRRKANAVNNA